MTLRAFTAHQAPTSRSCKKIYRTNENCRNIYSNYSSYLRPHAIQTMPHTIKTHSPGQGMHLLPTLETDSLLSPQSRSFLTAQFMWV